MHDGTAMQVVSMRQRHLQAMQPGAAVSLSVIDPAFCAVYPA